MKAKRNDIRRALSQPADDVRLFLLYGPDRAGSEDLAKVLFGAMGDEAERVDIPSGDLKGNPALLADEAASISLFGGSRYIRIDPAGDEITAAVTALGQVEKAGNPVVAVAGALRGTNKLVKLVNASSSMMAFASYSPEGRDADRMVIEIAQQVGVQILPDVARRLAAACGGDRAVLSSELNKLASYLDAAPDRPRQLDHSTLDAVGADHEEGDMGRLANLVLSGELTELDHELVTLKARGIEGVPLILALLRRLQLLSKLRAQVEAGNSAQSVVERAGRAIFWKEKDMVTRQLRMWRADALATAAERVLSADRALRSSGGAGMIAVSEELFAIARKAKSLR